LLEKETSALVDLGLTLLQARVYLALTQLGTTRAPRLAATVGIVRPEVYRILRELASKGLVQRNLTSPSTFTAMSPEAAVGMLGQEIHSRLMKLEKSKKYLVASLSSLAPTVNETPEYRISLIESYNKAEQMFARMLAGAREEYVAITGKRAFTELVNDGLARTIISAKRRGVRVRIIADIDSSNSKTAKLLSRYIELRRIKDTLFYVDIIDKKEMLFGSVYMQSDQSERKESDLWTSNPRFINGMYAMFENLWATSPKYESREL
jgi:sugar-specific transcriptional regulator TrmB